MEEQKQDQKQSWVEDFSFICTREAEGYKTMIPFSKNWLMLTVYLCHATEKERHKGAFKNSCKGSLCFATSLLCSTVPCWM